jgi:GNAT superfamily N-acetyltransferase
VAPERRSRGLGGELLAETIQRCRVGRMTLITDTAEGLVRRHYVGRFTRGVTNPF